jgi:hypothetical protein
VCRRKIILLHLLLFDRFAQLSELSVSLRSAVAMPFPKHLPTTLRQSKTLGGLV